MMVRRIELRMLVIRMTLKYDECISRDDNHI